MTTPRYMGLVTQGEDEQLIYSVTTTNWGASPTNVSVVAKDTTDDSDVSSTVLSGSSSVSGNVITLPTVVSLTADKQYRIEIKFTASSNIFEGYFLIDAET